MYCEYDYEELHPTISTNDNPMKKMRHEKLKARMHVFLYAETLGCKGDPRLQSEKRKGYYLNSGSTATACGLVAWHAVASGTASESLS